MKKLLFVLCLVVSTTLFYSCGDDAKDDDPQITDEVTIVQNSLKGKFYDVGITAFKFNDKNVDVWTDIINSGEYYQYTNVLYKIYPEKQYIVINTTPKETLLYYEIVNNKVYLYADNNKQTILTDSKKPNNMENETKEPNKDVTTFTVETHYTEFNTTEYLQNGIRTMYVKDKKTNETILTFNWHSYNEISQIKRVDIKSRGNLLGFNSGGLYIKEIIDSNGDMYRINSAQDNKVKIIDTKQHPQDMSWTTYIDVNLRGKYIGMISINYK